MIFHVQIYDFSSGDAVNTYSSHYIIKIRAHTVFDINFLISGRVAWWLATCARKPKLPGSSPAASYVQR